MLDGWIGVGLDGALAYYDGITRAPDYIGKPVPAMVKRVKQWLREGREVRIFTERANPRWSQYGVAVTAIELWCEKVFGEALPVTNEIDFDMALLYEARCIQIEENTGIPTELR